MPRIDPNTGCEVLTTPEVIASMAEHDGVAPEEIWEDIYTALEEDSRITEQMLRDQALHIIVTTNDQQREWIEDELPHPVALVEVLEVHANTTMRGSQSMLKARVRCEDGIERIATYTAWDDPGTYYDPPEYEETVEWEE
jgi:hypothetical protein